MALNLVWTEKYRPKTLDEIIGQDVEKIRRLIQIPSSMPHFLFHSASPGTGKTSMAYVIRNEIGCQSSEFKTMNSSDERKLDTIRGLKDFAISKTSTTGIPRIVHMDEFDGMLGATQDALRFIMEKYSANCKFILTANDKSKITAYIQSRCTVIEMKEPPKDKVFEKLEHICKMEKVEYEIEALKSIIEIYYPDMRSMIKKLQELSTIGVLLKNVKNENALEDNLYDIMKKGNAIAARKYVIENNLEPKTTLKRIMNNMLDDEELDKKLAQKFSWDIATIEFRIILGSDKEVQLIPLIFRFIDTFNMAN